MQTEEWSKEHAMQAGRSSMELKFEALKSWFEVHGGELANYKKPGKTILSQRSVGISRKRTRGKSSVNSKGSESRKSLQASSHKEVRR